VILRSDTEFVVEGVVPDLLHIIPVGHDAVLDGVLQGQDTALGLSLITDIGVLLAHANHHTLVTGASNNGWEHSAGSVITGEAGFAHSTAVVNNEGLNISATFSHC
jgi:hypothetical protein